MRRPTARVDVLRRAGEATERRRDRVASEEPLEIRVVYGPQGSRVTRPVSVTMRTPGHDFELATGFLFSEGIVGGRSAVVDVRYCLRKGPQQFNVVEVRLAPGARVDEALLVRNFYTSSSCGVCGKASLEAVERRGCRRLPLGALRLSAALVPVLPARLRETQRLFDETGGLHAAGVFDGDGLLELAREDVGRHNAVDKVLGEALLAGRLPLSASVLVVSGRASFEILQKAVAAEVPIVVAVGAPSSLAVDLARRFHVTLAAFARGDRFNVYTAEERIV